jgi:hypothetical protein
MFSKSRSAANERLGHKDTLYSRLRGEIPPMRKPGRPPQKDPSTFSKYYCDLCNDSFPLTEIKQCTLCGRWACPSCWTEDFYVCNSCHGVIKLHTLPAEESPSVKGGVVPKEG